MTYDAVIVGAGVMGCATAYWLARAGSRVLILDMNKPGHGNASSSDESRAIRHQYRGRDFYTEMVAESVGLWKDFESEVGHGFYQETGLLMLQTKPGHPPLLRGYEGLERLGYRPQWLDAADIKRRYPQFDGIDSGVFAEGPDGFIRAREAVVALAERAVALGAEIQTGAQVVELAISGDQVSSVRAADGRTFEGDAYVIAAGPWTERLLPNLQIPVTPTAQRLHYLRPSDSPAYTHPRFLPFAILDTGFYGFPVHWNGSLKIADDRIGPEFDPDADREAPDTEALNKMRDFLRRHLPGLVDAAVTYSKTCAYAMTPDAHFIIDAVPGASNAFVAAGFSGHGFKFGILIGQILRDLVIQGQTGHDISPFQLDRALDLVEEHW